MGSRGEDSFARFPSFAARLYDDLMKTSLRDENLLRRVAAPRFMMKQLKMTYRVEEIVAIVEGTTFAESHEIERMTIAGLPVWIRIKLEKGA